jgi:hypothetical protein
LVGFWCNEVANNAAMSIGTDNNIRRQNRSILQNDTRPSFILVKFDGSYRSFKSDGGTSGNCQSI